MNAAIRTTQFNLDLGRLPQQFLQPLRQPRRPRLIAMIFTSFPATAAEFPSMTGLRNEDSVLHLTTTTTAYHVTLAKLANAG